MKSGRRRHDGRRLSFAQPQHSNTGRYQRAATTRISVLCRHFLRGSVAAVGADYDAGAANICHRLRYRRTR
jgi:hypothetical protein